MEVNLSLANTGRSTYKVLKSYIEYMNWPFLDRETVLVFTNRDIVDQSNWIHYVSHDNEDGAWQFLSENGSPEDVDESRVVLFRNIVKLDCTLLELADLPKGWIAWRNTKTSAWQRKLA
jgi:hypothetical protein